MRTPRLFSYGTLQDADVQLATFGRVLRGETDELAGFTRALVRIAQPEVAAAAGRTHYDNVRASGRESDRVSGTVFEVTDAELAAADRYEEDAGYSRVVVTLVSGKRAWVYRSLGDHT